MPEPAPEPSRVYQAPKLVASEPEPEVGVYWSKPKRRDRGPFGDF